MKAGELSNKGNVDDIKASLSFGRYDIWELNKEIRYEQKNKNRSTVIKLYQAEIRKHEHKNKK